MDLKGYLGAIRKSWWIVVLFVVIGGAGAGVLAYRKSPVYAAYVSFYVATPNTTSSTAYSTDQYAQARATSYARLLSSDRLAKIIVAGTPSLGMTEQAVASEISASAQLNTVVVDTMVQDTSPARALKIATAIGDLFPTMAEQLDNAPGAPATVRVAVVSGPKVTSAPVAPRKKLDIAAGLGIGLLLGLIAAVVRELLDTSIRSTDELAQLSGAPVVGLVPYDSTAKRAPLVVGEAAHGLRAESMRALRTSLTFVDAAEPVQTLLVTSSVENEGKSTVSTNLAIAFAEGGKRTLLVEGDLRKPRVGDFLELERAVGLTNVLAGQVSLDEALQSWGPNDLRVLLTGTIPPNPSELLGSPAMQSLLAELRGRFDTVVFDAPPLLPVTDAAVLSTVVDGVVLVFRYRKTGRHQLRSAVRTLDSVNARLVGSVFNMLPRRGTGVDYYAGYGYGELASEPSSGFWSRFRHRTKAAGAPRRPLRKQRKAETPDRDADTTSGRESARNGRTGQHGSVQAGAKRG